MHKASPYSCNRPFGVCKNVVVRLIDEQENP